MFVFILASSKIVEEKKIDEKQITLIKKVGQMF
jgi:hypothetical protein